MRVCVCMYLCILLKCSSSSPQVNLEVVPLLCACDHPNLARVHGYIIEKATKHLLLVSQFVEGQSLATLLVSGVWVRVGGGGWGVMCCVILIPVHLLVPFLLPLLPLPSPPPPFPSPSPFL